MADPLKNPLAPVNLLLPSSKAKAEEARYFKEADKKRTEAARKLLNPDDIANGRVDVTKELMTMLGGQLRMLTTDDLHKIKRIIERRGSKLKKGVTAKDVLKLAVPIPTTNKNATTDKQKASTEIKNAIPFQSKGSLIKFITNSGPDSDRQRHYVKVEFINFEAIAASAIKPMFIVQEMQKSPLKISCDCGRWRYWLAYMATIGGYNSGVRETAFPKIRNPGLYGIACKHILRVMWAILKSPSISQYMLKMVTTARQTSERRMSSVRLPQQQRLLKAIQGETGKNDLNARTVKQGTHKLTTQDARLKAVVEKSKANLLKVTNTSKLYNSKEKTSYIRTLTDLGMPKAVAETAWTEYQKKLAS